MAEQEVRKVEICLSGNFGAGKTSLMDRFVNNRFEDQKSTVNVDFMMKDVEWNGKKIKLKVLDTGGKSSFLVINFKNS